MCGRQLFGDLDEKLGFRQAKVMNVGIILQRISRALVRKGRVLQAGLRDGEGRHWNKLDHLMTCDPIDPFGETFRTVAPQALRRKAFRSIVREFGFEEVFVIHVIAVSRQGRLIKGPGSAGTESSTQECDHPCAITP